MVAGLIAAAVPGIHKIWYPRAEVRDRGTTVCRDMIWPFARRKVA